MKLSQYILSGTPCCKKVKLTKTIKTEEGVFKKGTTGHIVLKFQSGEYHFENNKGAFKVKENEFTVL